MSAIAEEKKMAGPSTRVCCKIGHTVTVADQEDATSAQYYEWTMYVEPDDPTSVAAVTYHLHNSFTPSTVTVRESPFALTRRGWGTFKVNIDILDGEGENHRFSQNLNFDRSKTEDLVNWEMITGAHIALGAPRMEGVSEQEMHGHRGQGQGWNPPMLITECDEDARPGYNTMKAHEYHDDPPTLRKKVRVMANMLRQANHPVAYTGAGISTAAGVDDYASKSKNSAATGTKAKRRKNKSGLSAEPTFAHHVLTALYRAGHLAHWVQQNHDGLPQKAGFPQQCINEIHGAWFDPSNPVVPMSGSLRDDLYAWMEDEEERADLVLTMGTSLCGMNADRMVQTPSEKCITEGIGLGSIIIGFQRTQLDSISSLRIFGSIDHVMQLLVEEMQLQVGSTMYQPSYPPGTRVHAQAHKFRVPYDTSGQPVDGTGRKMMLNLDAGARIKVTAGPGKGFTGRVLKTPDQRAVASKCSYLLELPMQREGHPKHGTGLCRYALGAWMVEAACRGELHMLPIVNV